MLSRVQAPLRLPLSEAMDSEEALGSPWKATDYESVHGIWQKLLEFCLNILIQYKSMAAESPLWWNYWIHKFMNITKNIQKQNLKSKNQDSWSPKKTINNKTTGKTNPWNQTCDDYILHLYLNEKLTYDVRTFGLSNSLVKSARMTSTGVHPMDEAQKAPSLFAIACLVCNFWWA